MRGGGRDIPKGGIIPGTPVGGFVNNQYVSGAPPEKITILSQNTPGKSSPLEKAKASDDFKGSIRADSIPEGYIDSQFYKLTRNARQKEFDIERRKSAGENVIVPSIALFGATAAKTAFVDPLFFGYSLFTRPVETIKGVGKSIRDIPQLPKKIVQGLKKSPASTVGTIYGVASAPAAYGALTRASRNIYISAQSRKVPVIEKLEPGSIEATRVGGIAKYPRSANPQAMLKDFEKGRLPTGNIKAQSSAPAPIGRPIEQPLGRIKVTPGASETPGFYLAPKGRGSPAYFQIIDSPGSFRFSWKPTLFKKPSLIEVELQDIKPLPTAARASPEAESVFLQSQKGTGKAFLTRKVYRQKPPEAEAVIPEGSLLQLKRPRGILPFIRGSNEFFNVEGYNIPIYQFKLSGKGLSSSQVAKKVRSGMYRRGDSTISPARLGFSMKASQASRVSSSRSPSRSRFSSSRASRVSSSRSRFSSSRSHPPSRQAISLRPRTPSRAPPPIRPRLTPPRIEPPRSRLTSRSPSRPRFRPPAVSARFFPLPSTEQDHDFKKRKKKRKSTPRFRPTASLTAALFDIRSKNIQSSGFTGFELRPKPRGR